MDELHHELAWALRSVRMSGVLNTDKPQARELMEVIQKAIASYEDCCWANDAPRFPLKPQE